MSELAYPENATMTGVAMPAPTIPGQLSYQREAVDALAKAVDVLAERLSPVLGPHAPMLDSAEKRPPHDVPLADDIASTTERLHEIRGRLESLIARLGV